MAKKVTRIAKLQFQAGQAKPGPELAGLGIDMGGFTKEFNDATRERNGEVVPVVITAYDDRSYEFVLKTTPTSFLLKKAAGVAKGSGTPQKEKVGTVTMEQVKEIAEYKMEDLNTNNLDSAISQVIGAAKSTGIIVEGNADTEIDEAALEAAKKAEAAAAKANAAAEAAVEAGAEAAEAEAEEAATEEEKED